jgi:hypothetical protein
LSISQVPDILSRIQSIHSRKNHDYASENNPFSNFERSGELASWFKNSTDKSFAVLIGVKLARLAELTSGNKSANNESIDDSFLDLCTYCVLWMAYNQSKKNERTKSPLS